MKIDYRLALLCLLASCGAPSRSIIATSGVRVGAASAEMEADDTMITAGGIHPGKAAGQEGKLRAIAVVVEKPGAGKCAIVACDVLMANRDLLDEAATRIEKSTGIPFANVLINCTHTHHAPSTCTIHGYERNTTFSRRLVEAIDVKIGMQGGSLDPPRRHRAGLKTRAYVHSP